MSRTKRPSAAPLEPAPEEIASTEERLPLPWTVGTWAGLANYACRHCPYSTPDEWRIRSHRCEL